MSLFLLLIQVIIYVVAIVLLGSTRVEPLIIYFLIVVNWCLWIYSFRFQRTTLAIARMVNAEGVQSPQSNIQMSLTPDSLNILVWSNTLLSAIVFAFIGSNYNWAFAVLYIVAKQIGVGFIDSWTPIPSYNHCFNIIEGHLHNQVKNNESDVIRLTSTHLLGTLSRARLLYNESKLKM